MPTVPSGGLPRPLPAAHQARQLAGSFGGDPDRYDRSRPRYPDAVVARIVATSPGPDVLDVGCGTGIVARQFQAAGCAVLGVDVDERMAGWARQRGLAVEVAAFENWDPAGRTFDAVVSGQSWHWVDPVAGAANAARVLRPGGRLAVFWNAGQPPPEVAEALVAVCRRVLPDSLPDSLAARWATTDQTDPTAVADGYARLGATAADGMRQVGAFDDPEQWHVDWERSYTRDQWLDQLPTTGAFTQLPLEMLTEVLAGVGAAIDEAGGRVVMRYTTVVTMAARIRTT